MMILRSDILTGKVRFSLGLLGICFWRKVREERVWTELMGKKGLRGKEGREGILKVEF